MSTKRMPSKRMLSQRMLAGVSLLLILGMSGEGFAAVKKKKKPVDKTPPVIKITTQDLTTVYSSNSRELSSGFGRDVPAYDVMVLSGTATDNMSGVSSVLITYKACKITDYRVIFGGGNNATCGAGASPGLEQQASPCATGCGAVALVTCVNKLRKSCTWESPPPLYPGIYMMSAVGLDLKKNVGRAKPITILVV